MQQVININPVQDRNYVDSRIMDFSTSWTVPNIRLDRALGWDPKRLIDEADTNDYFMFDDMIEKWNNEHPDETPSSYRMTQGDKYRPVAKAPRTRGSKRNSSSSSSGSSSSSEEMEEVPALERMRDNRYLVLASSYDWVGRKPAVAQPEILAPPTPGINGGDQGTMGPSGQPGPSAPPRWPPLAFYVPEFPITGFPLPGFPTPGSPSSVDGTTGSPTTPGAPGMEPSTTEPTVPGPSTLGLNNTPPGPSTSTPGPGDGVTGVNSSRRRTREARKLEAIREAAGGLIPACDALKAMAQNIIDIIDGDDSANPGGDDDHNHDDGGSGGDNQDGNAPPGTREQQQQQQPAQQPPGAAAAAAAAQPDRWSRRRMRGREDDGHDARPARRPRWDRGGSLRPLPMAPPCPVS